MNAETAGYVKRFDDATTAVAAEQKSLLDRIAEGGLTPEVKTAFDATLARLEALGSDPQNPIPAQPPVTV